ncbi:MAG: glycosyltransferase family 4 protein [Cyanobacteria bacterium J06635_10]
MKVVFLSRWLGNPYKRILAKHLADRDATVTEHRWSVFFLPKVFSNGIPDILHLHTLHPFLIPNRKILRPLKVLLFVSQILFLRVLSVKTVWTVHEWNDKIKNGEDEVSGFEAKTLGKIFHSIIVHCDSTKKEICRSFCLEGNSKILVIPHGNYIEHYQNKLTQKQAREALQISNENIVFLIFGSIYPYKGILEAIYAFKQLDSKSSSLVIAGKFDLSTPIQRDLEEAIKAQTSDATNIKFIPTKIPDDDVQIYMNACDCVLTPYRVFTTSGVTLLGMSFGKACIAPKIGFFNDILDNCGAILYQFDDESGLFEAMDNAISRRQFLDKMGAHNFELAKQCSWEYVAERTLLAYAETHFDEPLNLVSKS